MNNKRLINTTITIFILMFFLSWIEFNILFATMVVTAEAITCIIIYYMQKYKRNDSMKVKFILLITYLLGAILAMILTVAWCPLGAAIIEISLFILVIYLTNRIKQTKGRIT